MDWLIAAFGFVERARILDAAGRLAHGELLAGESVIMLAAPTLEYQSPKNVAERYEPARQWRTVPWIFNGVLVYVDDVDAHFKRAKAHGARILSEIEDGGPGRRYRAEDLEGQRWFFIQRAA
jgi:PhnB protein